jgi:hypothetical protein
LHPGAVAVIIPGQARNFIQSDNRMTPAAILTFVLIAGFVWGGFALIVRKALAAERRKRLEA